MASGAALRLSFLADVMAAVGEGGVGGGAYPSPLRATLRAKSSVLEEVNNPISSSHDNCVTATLQNSLIQFVP